MQSRDDNLRKAATKISCETLPATFTQPLTMTQLSYSQLVEIGVLNGQVPQYIYKYRTMAQLKKLLENNCLWFANPNEFNDPFDCQINPDTNNSQEEIKEFLKRYSPSGLSEEKIDELASNIYNDPIKWSNTIRAVFRKVINETGICCFTKNETNLLMWSHYTDSHKGVCVKFDIMKDTNYFALPLKVNYTKDYPYYNHLLDRHELVKIAALSKSIDWSYEDEVRILKLKHSGLLSFNREALVEIIFGCNSSVIDRQDIIEMCAQNNFQVIFKQAEKKEREFGLNIKAI